MPKIVDPNERKEHIAEAVWRVIRREGLDGVSVRKVADEAGISLGSLRHYFDAQDELLAFSMRLLSSRVHERIRRLPYDGEPRRDIERIIAELLPLDEIRIAEVEVWLAFAGKAVSDPAIRALSREVHIELYEGFRGMIGPLLSEHPNRDAFDAEYETKRLHALVDGLVVHHTNYPDRSDRNEMMRTVSKHLDSLMPTN